MIEEIVLCLPAQMRVPNCSAATQATPMTAAPATSMPIAHDIPDWRITGDWWDLCNCAIGCPCNFGSDPTLGYCEGVLT